MISQAHLNPPAPKAHCRAKPVHSLKACSALPDLAFQGVWGRVSRHVFQIIGLKVHWHRHCRISSHGVQKLQKPCCWSMPMKSWMMCGEMPAVHAGCPGTSLAGKCPEPLVFGELPSSRPGGRQEAGHIPVAKALSALPETTFLTRVKNWNHNSIAESLTRSHVERLADKG